MKHVIITGGAGFIGSHVVEALLKEGDWKITIIDNFDPFYDSKIKYKNISVFKDHPHVILLNNNICDIEQLRQKLKDKYDVIIHLAAKAGVRPSIEHSLEYQKVNVGGTHNMLELAKEMGIKQFIFASSSSVYGENPNFPWTESDVVLKPISPYAATKAAGEMLGHVYSHLYPIRFIALRFFTVYGPRQRPDLAIYKFYKAIAENRPITMYGDGSTKRDYTYVSEIVSGVRAAMDYEATNYEIINLGNNKTISLKTLIDEIEKVLDKKSVIQKFPEQPGDVFQTCANIEKAARLLNYSPSTTITSGLTLFKEWFNDNVLV